MKDKHIQIVLGESAGGLLVHELGYRPGSLLVQQDPLTVGPLPFLSTLEEWRTVRKAFWDRSYTGSRRPGYRHELLWRADRLRKCDAITVWVGGGATDQLLLPWVVHLFTLLDVPICSMWVVQIERLSARGSEVIGIGELSPEQLRTHAHPAQLSPDDIAELNDYCSALTAPHPQQLLRSIERETTAFPLLRRALRTTLDRFPDARTGLSHWDLELLKRARSHGPKVPYVIGQLIGDSSNANYPDSVGDFYLFSRL